MSDLQKMEEELEALRQRIERLKVLETTPQLRPGDYAFYEGDFSAICLVVGPLDSDEEHEVINLRDIGTSFYAPVTDLEKVDFKNKEHLNRIPDGVILVGYHHAFRGVTAAIKHGDRWRYTGIAPLIGDGCLDADVVRDLEVTRMFLS